jgi:hypothetical protein
MMEENMSRQMRKLAASCLAVLLLVAAPAAAQFNNGSSGIHGNLPPGPLPDATQFVLWNLGTGLLRYCSTYELTPRPDTCTSEVGTAQIPNIPPGGLTSGVYEFDHVNLAASPFFGFLYVIVIPNAYNAPLSILSKNELHFTSVLFYADGLTGAGTASGLQPNVSLAGGRPGPGGFAGGAGGFAGTAATDGNAGFGPGGGGPGTAGAQCDNTWGLNALAPIASTTLTQLVGGSGGGGGASTTTCALGHNNGSAGGGGGGALLLSANTQITFDGNGGYLYVNGGNGGSSLCGCYEGGGGAGGSLKLVAPRMTGFGSATLTGGSSPRLGAASGGVIRVEGDATQLSLSIVGQSTGTLVVSPGPITPAVTPSLRITSIGDQSVRQAPTGNTATPDVSFATPPTGPVAVNLAAANIPLGTSVKVRVTPQVGSFTEVTSDPLMGTVASSTATASVTIPAGYGSITAVASFGCDGTFCALLPAKDRPGAIVEVVASAGTSRAFIVTKEGKRFALGN